MKIILQKNIKVKLAIAIVFSFFSLSLSAQEFSPTSSFAFNISAPDFSFNIEQDAGETDIYSSAITTSAGSFDFSSMNVGQMIGEGAGFIGGGAYDGNFELIVDVLEADNATLEVVNGSTAEVYGAMSISNNASGGVYIYSVNTYDDGNTTTAGNSQYVNFMPSSGFSVGEICSFTCTSSILSELDPFGTPNEFSDEVFVNHEFNPNVGLSLSNSFSGQSTNINFDISQISAEVDIASIEFNLAGYFDIAQWSGGGPGDGGTVVGSGSGSFGGGFASGNYGLTVAQVTATTATIEAISSENMSVLASFLLVNNQGGGATITSNSPGDNNLLTAGNTNSFTLYDFINPDTTVLEWNYSLTSECGVGLQSNGGDQYSLQTPNDFSPELTVEFSNIDCNEDADITFTISQDAGETDMSSSMISFTGDSLDFSSLETGDIVGTASGFYAGGEDFSLTLYVGDIMVPTGITVNAVNDEGIQSQSFNIENTATGFTITTQSPGDNNQTTAGNSTTVTLTSMFTNPDEGEYAYSGSFYSDSQDLFTFNGSYTVVCPCDDVEVSESVILCAGETLTIGDNTYSEAGDYINTYPLASGCDSIVTTSLSFSEVSTPTISGEINVTENTTYDYTGGGVAAESTLQWGVVNGEISSGQGTSFASITWGDGPSTGTVWLLVTDENGCKPDTAFLNVTISETVGILENNLLGVNVYPNPFKEFTTVEFNNPNNDTFRISLMDARGRTLMNTSTQSSQLIIKKENLQEGIYFLEIDGKNKSRQIVVVQ
jgi:hypothetical protein